MKHVSNEQKAKDITKCLWFPQKCTEEDIQNMLMQMAQWKDEQELQFLQSLMFLSSTPKVLNIIINNRIKLLKGE